MKGPALIRLGNALAFARTTQALVELVMRVNAMQLEAGRKSLKAARGRVEDAEFCMQALKQS